jgi:cysteine-rich repeat protein
VYVAGDNDDAIAVFHRDATTGMLTFLEFHRDGVAGVDGLDGAESIAVSADGTHLYAGGSDEKALAVFVRDPATGKLSFRAVQRNGTGDVDGLAGVGSVVVGADGLFVYAGGTDDDAVTVFSMRCGDGLLDPGEQCDDGNALPADACSPGCRLVCATASDCVDPDACTEDRCQQGECSMRHCALGGSICQVEDARAALLGETTCAPINLRLQRAINRRLKKAVRLLRRASLQRDPDLRALVKAVGTLVDKVDRKAGVLALRNRITPACRAAIADATALLDQDVSEMVLHRGICAP